MATLRNEYFNDETNKLSRFNVSQETIVHDNSIKEETSPEIPLTKVLSSDLFRSQHLTTPETGIFSILQEPVDNHL